MTGYHKTSQLLKAKKKRKKKASERKKLIRQLDQVVREILRERDEICGACGKLNSNISQVSHFIGRRHYALRWNLRNCHLQHAGCNLAHNHNPQPYCQFLIKEFGDNIFEEFEQTLRKHTKFSTAQLEEILEELRTQYSLHPTK